MSQLQCKNCGSAELYAEVHITVYAPLTAKGGGVKFVGLKFGQIDVKNAWELENGEKKKVRSPVVCAGCSSRYSYVTGSKDPLIPIGEG